MHVWLLRAGWREAGESPPLVALTHLASGGACLCLPLEQTHQGRRLSSSLDVKSTLSHPEVAGPSW